MPTFFHGWRRKIGVFTLLVACVFAAGWLRSLSFRDGVSYRSGKLSKSEIYLSRDGVSCTTVRHNREDFFDGVETVWTSDSNPGGVPGDGSSIPIDISNFKTHIQWCGFHFAYEDGWANDPDVRFEACCVPYWSIVIPLTILSAYLLLAKPRVAQPTSRSTQI